MRTPYPVEKEGGLGATFISSSFISMAAKLLLLLLLLLLPPLLLLVVVVAMSLRLNTHSHSKSRARSKIFSPILDIDEGAVEGMSAMTVPSAAANVRV